MNRKITLLFKILSIVLLSLGLVDATSAQQRPNIIFFAVDDMCDWVGAMGYKQAKTPNIDALA